jgi:hypothetical protein
MRLQQALKVDGKVVIMNRMCHRVMKVETTMLGGKAANKATTKQKKPASSKKKDSKTASNKGPPTKTKATSK